MTLVDSTATARRDQLRPAVWTRICRRDDLEPLWGEAALVGRSQVAVFRLPDERILAVGNADPVTGASVMSRGLVGSRGTRTTLASPLHKDVYDLETGECLTRPGELRLPVWRVRETEGWVEVAASHSLIAASHGTSDPEGRRAVASLVAAVARARPELAVHESFVDVQEPDVPSVLATQDPHSGAVIVPLLLSAGYHVHVDLAEAASTTGLDARVTGALGPDPRLVTVLMRRLSEAGVVCVDTDTRVVLAAAGSSDASATADCMTTGEALAAALGVPVSVGFVSAAAPRLTDAVAEARAHGGRVVVATYLLAPGYFADLVAASGADIVTAPLLRADEDPPAELVELVSDRFDLAL